MPNWCENDLTITGPVKDLKRFQKSIRSPGTTYDYQAKKEKPCVWKFDFNKVIPYPKKFRDQDKVANDMEKKRNAAFKKAGYVIGNGNPIPKDVMEAIDKKYPYIKDGFNSGGYEWCTSHWGTKWNLHSEVDVQGEPKDGEIYYGFSTAWAPPIPVIKKLGEMFPTLTFNLKYYEMGAGYQGELEIVENEITIEEDKDYGPDEWEADDEGNKYGRGG